jgi:hypothetical protein
LIPVSFNEPWRRRRASLSPEFERSARDKLFLKKRIRVNLKSTSERPAVQAGKIGFVWLEAIMREARSNAAIAFAFDFLSCSALSHREGTGSHPSPVASESARPTIIARCAKEHALEAPVLTCAQKIKRDGQPGSSP